MSNLHIQTKRKGDPFPSYCTGKCCTEFNILTIQHTYYSTHQLYLFQFRHIPDSLCYVSYTGKQKVELALHNCWIRPVLKTGRIQPSAKVCSVWPDENFKTEKKRVKERESHCARKSRGIQKSHKRISKCFRKKQLFL